MKKFLLVIITLIPIIASAQKDDWKMRMQLFNNVDSVLDRFNALISFDEMGVKGYSEKKMNQYESLFIQDAQVFDDIDAIYSSEYPENPYILREKSISEYLADFKKFYPDGNVINTINGSSISYDQLNQSKILVMISKEVTGTNKDKFKFQNRDTLLLTLKVESDQTTVRIESITKIRSHLVCLNDKDMDGVRDEVDRCPDKKGLIALQGCPDRDNDGIADIDDKCPDEAGTIENKGCPVFYSTLSIVPGVIFTSNETKPANLDFETGYTDLDAEQSSIGFMNKVKKESSTAYSADISFYFGRSKRIGLATGFYLNKFTQTLEFNNYHFEFMSVDLNNDKYRRIISQRDGKEIATFKSSSIPLLIKYRTRFSEKFGIEVGAGISFVSMTGKSDYVSNFDFEAIYHSRTKGDWFYAMHYIADTSDWLIVEKEVSKHGSSAVYFNNLAYAGYDVALNKNYNGTDNIETFTGISINTQLSAEYHINSNWSVLAGLQYMTGKLTHAVSHYKMIDKTTDAYDSFFNGIKEIKINSYGITAGIRLSLY